MTVLISPAELMATPAADVVIIDTRDPESYAAGHIEGAVNIHDIFTFLATSTPEGIAELTDKFAAAFGFYGHRLWPVLSRLFSAVLLGLQIDQSPAWGDGGVGG